MRYSLTVVTAPEAEPVTLSEAKLHLRQDNAEDDALITALIVAAREWCENYTRRSFVRRTYDLRMDCWPSEIRLPRAPVSSITSIQYVDDSGTQTLATDQYQTDIYSEPARIVPAYGVVWPVLKSGEINAVTVRYITGYGPGTGSPTDHAENVPDALKAAMKLCIGAWYEHREQIAAVQIFEVPFAVKALLAPFEIRDFNLE